MGKRLFEKGTFPVESFQVVPIFALLYEIWAGAVKKRDDFNSIILFY